MAKKKNDFEKSLNRVMEISEVFESDEMKLEEAIELYKEAMELINYCQNTIEKAERQVLIYKEGSADVLDDKTEEESELTSTKTDENDEKQKKQKTKKKSKTTHDMFELFSDIEGT